MHPRSAEYPAKEADPQLPPLTGVRSREGLELPLPRRSLGVEFVHKGVSDRYFVLIPRTLDSPCSARQVFTTVHDNQEQVSGRRQAAGALRALVQLSRPRKPMPVPVGPYACPWPQPRFDRKRSAGVHASP